MLPSERRTAAVTTESSVVESSPPMSTKGRSPSIAKSRVGLSLVMMRMPALSITDVAAVAVSARVQAEATSEGAAAARLATMRRRMVDPAEV
jgi:hypothetical protein